MYCLALVNGKQCPNPPTAVARRVKRPVGHFCETCVAKVKQIARIYHVVDLDGQIVKEEDLNFVDLEAE